MSSDPTRRRVLLATGNTHKTGEIAEILGEGWEVVARDPDVEETGTTFEANALLKARALRDLTGELAVADDSGIEIDALDGAPGIQSARWTHEGDWIPRVLRELEGRGALAPEQRGCRYVCAAAVARPDGTEAVVRGVVEGVVVDAPRGTGGFGYDPLVAPLESDGRTFGELSPDEKHRISHRARAFRTLLDHLDHLDP